MLLLVKALQTDPRPTRAPNIFIRPRRLRNAINVVNFYLTISYEFAYNEGAGRPAMMLS